MRRFTLWIYHQLHSPKRVLIGCAIFLCGSLLFDGTLFRLYKLDRDHSNLIKQIETLKKENESLTVMIEKAKDPNFIQHEAIDRYEMVGEDDLVFVFPDEG